MKINHIGYLIKKIEPAIKEFEKLGFSVISQITHDTIRHVDIVFIQNDSYVIELVSPYDTDSVVAQLLKKFKNMPYHICYETQDFEEVISYYSSNGYTVMEEACIAPAFDNRRVVFLMNAKIGIIELLESE